VTGEIFDEDQFDEDELELDDIMDDFDALLINREAEIHGDAVATDIDAPEGIRAKVSINGVSVHVEEGTDPDVVGEFMENITDHVAAAMDEPEPIDTSAATAPDATPAPTSRIKLTPDDVRAIRIECAKGDESYAKIGVKFNVHRRTIEKIDKGDIWSSVT
jgi:hypothetical protein